MFGALAASRHTLGCCANPATDVRNRTFKSPRLILAVRFPHEIRSMKPFFVWSAVCFPCRATNNQIMEANHDKACIYLVHGGRMRPSVHGRQPAETRQRTQRA